MCSKQVAVASHVLHRSCNTASAQSSPPCPAWSRWQLLTPARCTQDEEQRARPAVQGGGALTAGRKSAAADAAADAAAKAERRKARKGARTGKAPAKDAGVRTNFSKSAAVFGALQDRAEAAAASGAAPARAKGGIVQRQ